MPTWMLVLWIDIRDGILGTELADLTLPLFFSLWLIILFMPLIGVDRRDPIAGMVFALYCTASGAALVFAIPQDYMPARSMKLQAVALTCMALAAGIRWVVGYYKQHAARLAEAAKMAE